MESSLPASSYRGQFAASIRCCLENCELSWWSSRPSSAGCYASEHWHFSSYCFSERDSASPAWMWRSCWGSYFNLMAVVCTASKSWSRQGFCGGCWGSPTEAPQWTRRCYVGRRWIARKLRHLGSFHLASSPSTAVVVATVASCTSFGAVSSLHGYLIAINCFSLRGHFRTSNWRTHSIDLSRGPRGCCG